MENNTQPAILANSAEFGQNLQKEIDFQDKFFSNLRLDGDVVNSGRHKYPMLQVDPLTNLFGRSDYAGNYTLPDRTNPFYEQP